MPLLLLLVACAPEDLAPTGPAPGVGLLPLDDGAPVFSREATYDPPDAECDARYMPDDCTVAAASTQWVDYESAVDCSGGAQPGATALAEYLDAAFPDNGGYGIYNCRTIDGTSSLSLHAEGRAIDFMIPTDSSQAYGADNGVGDPVADFLMENAEAIGIQSFIWDRTIYYGDEDAPKHHCVSIEDGHWNHLHIELSWAAARMETAWFNPPYEAPDATSNPGAALPAVSTVGAPGFVNLVGPVRLFDTRQASTSTGLVRVDGSRSGPLQPGGENRYADWAAVGLGAEDAVWMNLVAVGDGVSGYLSTWPSGGATPSTSSLNYSCRQPVRANAAPVALGSGDGVSVGTLWAVEGIADVSATFGASGGGLVPVTPTRLLDSRDTGRLAAGEVRRVPVSCAALGAACDDADLLGIAATVTAVSPSANGFLTVYPCGGALPAVSTLNYEADGVVANSALSAVGEGALCVYSPYATDVLVDAVGLVSATDGLAWQGLAPTRLLDTRQAGGLYVGRLGAGQLVELPVGALPGLPAGTEAVAVNLTVLDGDGSGYATAWPCDAAEPATSSINFTREDATAALALSRLSSDGRLCVRAHARTHLLVDLVGAWVEVEDSPTDTGGPDDSGGDNGGGDSGGDGGADNGGSGGGDTDGGPSGDGPGEGQLPGAGCACAAAPTAGDGLFAGGLLLSVVATRRRRSRAG